MYQSTPLRHLTNTTSSSAEPDQNWRTYISEKEERSWEDETPLIHHIPIHLLQFAPTDPSNPTPQALLSQINHLAFNAAKEKVLERRDGNLIPRSNPHTTASRICINRTHSTNPNFELYSSLVSTLTNLIASKKERRWASEAEFPPQIPTRLLVSLASTKQSEWPPPQTPGPSSPVLNQKPWRADNSEPERREKMRERESVCASFYLAAAGPKAEATSPMRAGGMAIDGVPSCYMTHSLSRTQESSTVVEQPTIPSNQDKHKMEREE